MNRQEKYKEFELLAAKIRARLLMKTHLYNLAKLNDKALTMLIYHLHKVLAILDTARINEKEGNRKR